jgi:hypothetical protein
MYKVSLTTIVVLLLVVLQVAAQKTVTKKHADEAYWEVVSKRAEKIVSILNIDDEAKFGLVRDLIAQQYYDLNGIHDQSKASKEQVKKESENKEAAAAKVEKIQQKADKELAKLHKKYLQNLSKELNPEQVEGVKNGMTYGVVPITYTGYLDMIPELTQEEQQKIHDWLVDAREHAMDAGSSEEKHGWFGKYKGRINNYLSVRGYDLKKLSKEWEERVREAQKKVSAEPNSLQIEMDVLIHQSSNWYKKRTVYESFIQKQNRY